MKYSSGFPVLLQRVLLYLALLTAVCFEVAAQDFSVNASWIVSATAFIPDILLTSADRTLMQPIAAEIAKHSPTPPLKLSCRRLAVMAASMVRILGLIRRYVLTCLGRQYQQPGSCQYVLRSCTSGHLQWKQDVDGHCYHQSAHVGKQE